MTFKITRCVSCGNELQHNDLELICSKCIYESITGRNYDKDAANKINMREVMEKALMSKLKGE